MEHRKDISVLFPCTNFHSQGDVNSLRKEGVKVYCANCDSADLPTKAECDGAFIVPPVADDSYISALVQICKENKIDIIMPVMSIGLDTLSKHKDVFEKEGVKVSIVDYDVLNIINNKSNLYKEFGAYMPMQMLAKSGSDVYEFSKTVGGKFCCKLSDLSGGKGFAVVDGDKYLDMTLFHRYGIKHYLSLEAMAKCVDKHEGEVILQEYVDGLDYSVSLLADHGKITHICGYVGYILEFGSIMYGEIKPNQMAFDISAEIVKRLNLDGNIALDFILKEDGSVVLLEVNPRVNASMPFVDKAGCNMAYLRCLQLLGEDISKYDVKITEGLKMRKYFDTRYYI